MQRNWYTRRLHPKRRDDDNGRFLFFECSLCSKIIDAQPEDVDGLEKLFLEHIKSNHPDEIQK
jgi:hypothetical protein